MRLNSKLIWGLAWAGLALVIAVPSVDFLTAGKSDSAAVITSDTDPVKTASIPAATTPRAIELAPAAKPAKVTLSTVSPAVVAEPVAEQPGTGVASLTPSPKLPPFPAPLSQRPRLSAPAATQPVPVEDPIVIPADVASSSVVMLPPADIPGSPEASDSGTLRQYLIARGLLEPGPGDSSATVNYSDSGGDYDPDGFYLSDGPNAESPAARRNRLDLLLDEDSEDWEFFLF